MKIGDLVKLKDNLLNDEAYLRKFKNQVGKIIDMLPNKQYYRVEFSTSKEYEDLGKWRLEAVKKPKKVLTKKEL